MLIAQPVKVAELAKDLCALPVEAATTEITGLAADSRAIRPGFLFAALPGTKAHGLTYIPQALKRGANCLLAPEHAELPRVAQSMPCLADPEPAKLFAHLSARFHQNQPEYLAAITGTNGKTSVAFFLRHIWDAIGHRAASIGTLGVQAGRLHCPAALTTPPPDKIYRLLALLARRQFSHAVVEASSHGLAQHRLDGLRLAAAGFTYLGRDHLDYHADRRAYLAAKLRLVRLLPDDGALALHAGAEGAEAFAKEAQKRGLRLLQIGKGQALELRGLTETAQGQRLQIHYHGQDYDIAFPLRGRFQAMNALMAASLALLCGAATDETFATLETMPPVPGRMQQVGKTSNGNPVLVDYAHTPDALEMALRTLKESGDKSIVLLVGCGGERDKEKRAQMGAIAHRLAARVIITDDNPRNEDPAAIRADMLAACPNAEEIPDRAEAIAYLLESLTENEIGLIAGRGHETHQQRAEGSVPFSDAAYVQTLLQQGGKS